MTTYTITEAQRQQLLAVLEEATTTDDGAAKWDRHSKATKVLQSLELVKGEAVAFLHEVVSGDGDSDEALSFNKDNFPFDSVAGYKSISHRPLYTHPLRELSDEEINNLWDVELESEDQVYTFARSVLKKARG